MFYGCQDELAVIVVEGQNPTLSRFGDLLLFSFITLLPFFSSLLFFPSFLPSLPSLPSLILPFLLSFTVTKSQCGRTLMWKLPWPPILLIPSNFLILLCMVRRGKDKLGRYIIIYYYYYYYIYYYCYYHYYSYAHVIY